MEDTNKPTPESVDDNLDALLNSSLSDFDKPLPKLPTVDNKSPNPLSLTSPVSGLKPNDSEPSTASAAWNEEYKQLQDAMQNFLGDDPSMKKELNNLVESLQPSSGSMGTGDNFAETFAATIKGLTESAQNVPEPSAEELENLLRSFDLGDNIPLDGGDQMPDFMPIMQTVMQNLMSKELLYPSLKDIVDKYPDWLANKRSTLDEQEHEKYSRQYDLMKEVCEEFETDCDGSDDAKKARFEKVLMLMQKVQSYGNPPKELVGELGQGLPLDEHGNMQIPGMPEQCILM